MDPVGSTEILLLIITVGFASRQAHPNAPRPAAFSAQDRRRSVTVLPFENTGSDPADDSLAAEITRDVTDMIATDNGVPIVSRAGAAAKKAPFIDLRSIARDEDVHFVLSGHFSRRDGHLAVVATLSQTWDERTVWT